MVALPRCTGCGSCSALPKVLVWGEYGTAAGPPCSTYVALDPPVVTRFFEDQMAMLPGARALILDLFLTYRHFSSLSYMALHVANLLHQDPANHVTIPRAVLAGRCCFSLTGMRKWILGDRSPRGCNCRRHTGRLADMHTAPESVPAHRSSPAQ